MSPDRPRRSGRAGRPSGGQSTGGSRGGVLGRGPLGVDEGAGGGAGRLLTLLLVVVVVTSTVAPAAFAGRAAAVSTTIELDAAADDQTETESLSFEFRADAATRVSAPPELESGGVTFEFDGWEAVGGGGAGSSSSWQVQQGARYEVTYEATAESGVDEGANSVGVTVTSSAGTMARETLRARVVYLEPAFGSSGATRGRIVFTGGDEASETFDVDVRNSGQGLMRPESVDVGDTPAGFDVDVSEDDLPDEIDARDSEPVEVDVTVDDSVDSGSYRFDVTVTDSLGNSGRYSLRVDVRRPPVAKIDGGGVDVGNVLVGESESRTVTVEERGENEGIDGLDVDVISIEDQGSVDVSAASGIRTSPGGSDQFEVTVSVDEDADQHQALDWTVRITPQARDAPTSSFEVEARVIYPAILGDVDAPDESLPFDEPRSEVSEHSTEVEVEIPNEGDLDMDVDSVTADVDRSGMSATVVDDPSTVGGTDEGTATVEITADPSVAEGTYDYTVSVDAGDAGEETITREIAIRYDPGLRVGGAEGDETVDFGEQGASQRRTATVEVSEFFGYERLENVTVRRIDGPDEFLAIDQRPPSTLASGDSAPLVFALEFDTSAELYRDYVWTYRISGDGAEPRNVTVRARPEVTDFTNITEEIRNATGSAEWEQETGSAMVESLRTLEERARAGEEISSGDLSRAAAAGRSTVLFIESVQEARSKRRSNGPDAAQSAVVRAAAAQRTMETYVSNLSTPAVSEHATPAVDASEPVVETEVSSQEQYYGRRLNATDATALQRATAARNLTRLASLRGESARVRSLRGESRAAFDSYLRLVENASAREQRARELESSFNESAAFVLLGRAVVVNPLRISELQARSETVQAAYAEAADTHARAGTTEEAAKLRAARSRVAGRFQQSLYILYGATGAFGIAFVGLVVWIVRQSVAYAVDVQTTRIGRVVDVDGTAGSG